MSRAKDYLLQIRKIDRMVENKIAEMEQWKALATSTVGAPSPDTGVRVQSSGNQQRMEAAISHYMMIEDEINACIDQLVDIKRDVCGVIEQLDVVEYDVLHKHYVGTVDKSSKHKRIKYWSLNEIAEAHDRSYNWAKKMRGDALKSVQRILDEREMQEKCKKLSENG